MDINALKAEATTMESDELRAALNWNRALAEHYDDNMDLTGYNAATLKVQVIKDELKRRGD